MWLLSAPLYQAAHVFALGFHTHVHLPETLIAMAGQLASRISLASDAVSS